MSSPGRPFASCLAVFAAALIVLGCGSSDQVKVDLPPETITAINAKLDQIKARFDAGDCTGSNSAETSLESLQAAVDGLDGVEQQFLDDMNQLLDNLGKQIVAQCQVPDPTTSSSTTTTDTVPTTTDTVPTTTDTTTTTTTTTTDTTKSTTTTSTTPTGPPGNPGNPNGNGPGGGVVPGGGKKAAVEKPKIDKPKPKHGNKPKHDGKERSR